MGELVWLGRKVSNARGLKLLGRLGYIGADWGSKRARGPWLRCQDTLSAVRRVPSFGRGPWPLPLVRGAVHHSDLAGALAEH